MTERWKKCQWEAPDGAHLRSDGELMAAVRETGPLVTEAKRPEDYADSLKRGTVEYRADWRNYSFHAVVIPDGAVIRACNFTQNTPNTRAISGANLTFVECNLVNNALDPSWKLERCNTSQAWLVDTGEKEKRVVICKHPDQLKGDERPPRNTVLARGF